MTDLDQAFRDAGQTPVADLWPAIVTRTPGRLPPERRGGRAATIVVALMIAVIAFGFAVGAFNSDVTAPARPSPSVEPPFTPSNFVISYDSSHLVIRGLDPGTGSGFSLRFYRGRTERACAGLAYQEPSLTQLGHPPFETITRCAPRVTVGDGVAIGRVVMVFVPPETASATARLSDGSLVDAQVLRLPSRFMERASSALHQRIAVTVAVLSRPEGISGDLIVRDGSGRSGTLPVTGRSYARIHDGPLTPVAP
jgi:hypothetical protein